MPDKTLLDGREIGVSVVHARTAGGDQQAQRPRTPPPGRCTCCRMSSSGSWNSTSRSQRREGGRATPATDVLRPAAPPAAARRATTANRGPGRPRPTRRALVTDTRRYGLVETDAMTRAMTRRHDTTPRHDATPRRQTRRPPTRPASGVGARAGSRTQATGPEFGPRIAARAQPFLTAAVDPGLNHCVSTTAHRSGVRSEPTGRPSHFRMARTLAVSGSY
jgi:hypothetical protein